MQKLNCILKIHFNGEELPFRAEKIKTLHTNEQNGALELAFTLGYSHCVRT